MAIPGVRLSPQAQRFAAAGLVVLIVAVSVWLFGRPDPAEPTVAVVVTTETWAAGRPPAGFVTVEMPESAAVLLATPEALEGRVPAVAVPAGVVVSEAMLADAATSPTDPAAAAVAVGVDLTMWPDPGPAAGDVAVLAAEAGGCAAAVLPVLSASGAGLVVEAPPQLAAVLSGGGVRWAWRSPPAGWPACPASPQPSSAATTLVTVGVDLTMWPAPGPQAGDTAVLAAEAGGCAAAVLAVLGVEGASSRLLVEASPELAAALGPRVWQAWESPADGWPACNGTGG